MDEFKPINLPAQPVLHFIDQPVYLLPHLNGTVSRIRGEERKVAIPFDTPPRPAQEADRE